MFLNVFRLLFFLKTFRIIIINHLDVGGFPFFLFVLFFDEEKQVRKSSW